MWLDFAAAIGLVLIIEGVLPFLYPNRWRDAVAKLALLDVRSMRVMGLVSMVIGLVIVVLAK